MLSRSVSSSCPTVRSTRFAGIDLSVTSGEVVALIGPNGAGKTSTLRAISGLVPHGGTVTFDGHDCRKRNIEGLARLGLIHVPEGRHVFPSLNVHENLQVGTTAAARAVRRVHASTTSTTCSRRSRTSRTATAGRSPVASSRWSRSVVRWWPSRGCCCSTSRRSGCRPSSSPCVYGALAQVSDRIPMLLVEQNTVMALRHCTRAAVLVGGKIVLEGTADELADREALVASYLGEEPALERDQIRPQKGDVMRQSSECRGDGIRAPDCVKELGASRDASRWGNT